MLNSRIATEALNAKVNAWAKLLDGGTLEFYDGKQPASVNEAPAKAKLLAALKFQSPAFPPAEDGVAESFDLTPDTDAKATGTATWYRVTKADGTAVMDGTVGREDADLIMNATGIQEHAEVRLKNFILSVVA